MRLGNLGNRAWQWAVLSFVAGTACFYLHKSGISLSPDLAPTSPSGSVPQGNVEDQIFSGEAASNDGELVDDLPPEQDEYATTITVTKKSTFYDLLKSEGLSPADILGIIKAAEPFKDLARVNSGLETTLFWQDESREVLRQIDIPLDGHRVLQVSLAEENHQEFQESASFGKWKSQVISLPVKFLDKSYAGTVEDSLWVSAKRAKMAPKIIAQLAEIFAWQVDFAREVQPGDSWRLTVQQKFVSGQFAGWGPIIAAEYVNRRIVHQAIRFNAEGEVPTGYYEPDGGSLQRLFLKAPVKFARITSKFAKVRFHPILKVNRPHLGIDYGAPLNTPVMATGDGTVRYVGWKGGGGKTIIVRHNSIYTSAYKHLNRFQKNLRVGSKVKQGQIIGFTGMTGLATGPHLHYEFYKNGRIIDPLQEKFPAALPLPSPYRERFRAYAQQKLAFLPGEHAVTRISQSTVHEKDSRQQ